MPSGPVTFVLEVTVPLGSDAATIRQAFGEAFARRAQTEYGAVAQVNRNVPPNYYGGDPALVGDDGTSAIYSAQMQGYLYAGQ